jgi:hypothetical protein
MMRCSAGLCPAILLLCLANLGALGADAQSGADSPSPQERQKIARLIEQLGADDFAQREEAAQELVEVGLVAYRQVEESVKNPDPEIRYRAAKILTELLDADFERRLQVFIAGNDEAERFPVPGWNQFHKLFGDTKEWREFFVELQKGDREMFQAIEAGPKPAQELLGRRLDNFQMEQRFGRQQTMQLAPAVAMLVAGSIEGVQENQNAAHANLLNNICYQQSVRDALTNGPRKNQVRSVLGNWIKSCEERAGYQAIMLAMQYDLAEGLVPAEKILNNEGVRQPYMSQFALLAVAKFGDASHIPAVEKLLTDKGICNRMQVNKVMKDTQVRDVALLTLAHLTKQDKKAFGFDRLQEAQPYMYNLGTMGIDGDPKREEALKKWDEVRKTLKLPPARERPAADKATAPEVPPP